MGNSPANLVDPLGLRVAAGARRKLGDAIAAATAAAAAAIADAIDDFFTGDDTSCGSTCEQKYPGYRKCNTLSHYDYTSEDGAFNGYFGGSRYARKGKRAKATGGPCAGYKGNHTHINIYDLFYGDYVGSIRSCQCCDDSSGEAVLIIKYRAFDY